MRRKTIQKKMKQSNGTNISEMREITNENYLNRTINPNEKG